MLDEAGFKFAFNHCIRVSQSLLYIPSRHASASQHILRAMSMDEPSTGRESFINGSEQRQFLPAYREGCRIKLFDCLCFADNRGDGFTPMASFLVRKNRLIRKAWNHAVTIFTRHVLGGKNRLHAGMSRNEGLQITEAKLRPMIRASDDT
jgi:hypothetical protein